MNVLPSSYIYIVSLDWKWILEVVTSISVISAPVFTFLTVIEMKKSRIDSVCPVLIISSQEINVAEPHFMVSLNMPRIVINNSGPYETIPISVTNYGNGIARNIKFLIKSNLDEICKLVEKSTQEIGKIKLHYSGLDTIELTSTDGATPKYFRKTSDSDQISHIKADSNAPWILNVEDSARIYYLIQKLSISETAINYPDSFTPYTEKVKITVKTTYFDIYGNKKIEKWKCRLELKENYTIHFVFSKK